jgi:hypothetical protein
MNAADIRVAFSVGEGEEGHRKCGGGGGKVVRGSAAWRVKRIMFIDLSSRGSLSRLEVSFAGHVPALLFLESAPTGTTGQRAKVTKMR